MGESSTDPIWAQAAANQLRALNSPRVKPNTESDPILFLRNITIGVLETMAGTRDVEQLMRWLAEDAYRKLSIRANLASRSRNARNLPTRRPNITIGSIRQSMPVAGVVEAVVIVHAARTRAIAIRLERQSCRWRATSLALL